MEILMNTKSNLAAGRRKGASPELRGMESPVDSYYGDTLHTITLNTRDTEFCLLQPITLRTYRPVQNQSTNDGAYSYQPLVSSDASVSPGVDNENNTAVEKVPNEDGAAKVRPPPKKKWIKEYLEEDPDSAMGLQVADFTVAYGNGNSLSRAASPGIACALPSTSSGTLLPLVSGSPPGQPSLQDFGQEHSKQRGAGNLGPIQIPSPTSVSNSSSCGNGSNGSSGSAPRAGTREVHNKLEKNRRAHLKECFELLKRQLPNVHDDKKTSNLSILGSAIRFIQVLRRKERECEHEIERLAREKIAAQQRLNKLKREVPLRPRRRPAENAEVSRATHVGNVVANTLSINSSPPLPVNQMDISLPQNVNIGPSLRPVPLQISPAPSQVVGTAYGGRHNTLTLTSLSPVDSSTQTSQENGVPSGLSALVHPAQIHLPITQVVSSGGLVVGPAALQLLSTSGLRVLQTPSVHTNGVAGESSMVVRENGLLPNPAASSGVVVSGVTPLVVSQPAAHLLQSHALSHKVVETQVVKSGAAPLTVSARYLSATSIVKPVVVVSSAPSSST